MPRYVRLLPFLLAACAMGCGGSAPVPAGADDRLGPHHGVLIALPATKGYAEILDERGRAGRSPARILVYLLAPDLKAPSSASVSRANVTITVIAGKPEKVALEPAPDAGDPLGKNRLASQPGQFALREAEGELVANLDGHEFRGAFDGSRIGR
jgi:hypothetical protein